MKEKYSKLEKAIKAMTAREIILAMVDSIKNPVTVIDMYTFGYKSVTGECECYGCAATNTILKTGELNPEEELTAAWKMNAYDLTSPTIQNFEIAIDSLRKGRIGGYNRKAKEGGFAEIKDTNKPLPYIGNHNYTDEEVLQAYIDLANDQ